MPLLPTCGVVAEHGFAPVIIRIPIPCDLRLWRMAQTYEVGRHSQPRSRFGTSRRSPAIAER